MMNFLAACWLLGMSFYGAWLAGGYVTVAITVIACSILSTTNYLKDNTKDSHHANP